MGLGVARGMAALEENDPPIVHRDLKPTNVFIDAGEAASQALTLSCLSQCHDLCNMLLLLVPHEKHHKQFVCVCIVKL